MINKIQLIRNNGCNWWLRAKEILDQAIQERQLSTLSEIIVIKNDEEAKQYRFFGSPQININGKDIDSTSERTTNFHASGCRIYSYKNKVYEYPPKEMIEETLDRHKSS